MLKFHACLTFLLLILITPAASLKSQSIDHWETVVLASSSWSYFEGSTAPPLDWAQPSFDASAWSAGPGGIGYGDGDDATLVSVNPSLFLRQDFILSDTSEIAAAVFHMDYDDAFVAYINGVEFARSNVDGSPPAFNDLANDWREAEMYSGGLPEVYLIDKATFAANFVQGSNTLAIQVHNREATSSDMSAIPFLSVGLTVSGSFYDPVPAWFDPTDFSFESTLPIVSINTFGQEIPNEDPRITANMQIRDRGLDSVNTIFDEPLDYDGQISIEIRGSSSAFFDKKSYALETQLPDGSNNNVSVIGMPVENDWILYAPYSDKSLMRNVLIYEMGRQLGRWAPRTRFCELLVNGQYQGVYVMMEKIKIDNDRVDIARLDSLDISGDELTGGYILKHDRINASGGEGWYSDYTSDLSGTSIYIQYEDPEYDELQPSQRGYIYDFMNEFEDALFGPDFMDSVLGHPAYLDGLSLIDFYFANEVTKNVDGYRLSTFFYKDRDSRNPRLQFGPIWDFNLGFANADYCEGWLHTGWVHEFETVCFGSAIPYWFERALEDSNYTNLMKCRWEELREGPWSNDSLNYLITRWSDSLDLAQARNFNRWPILGTYVWPNSYVGSTYGDEVFFLRNWLVARLTWMDSNLPGTCRYVAPPPPSGLDDFTDIDFEVSPNPFTDYLLVSGEIQQHTGPLSVKIYDAHSRLRFEDILEIGVGEFSQRLDLSIVPSGIYLFVVEANGQQLYSRLLSR